jgi:hypothetical protein
MSLGVGHPSVMPHRPCLRNSRVVPSRWAKSTAQLRRVIFENTHLSAAASGRIHSLDYLEPVVLEAFEVKSDRADLLRHRPRIACREIFDPHFDQSELQGFEIPRDPTEAIWERLHSAYIPGRTLSNLVTSALSASCTRSGTAERTRRCPLRPIARLYAPASSAQRSTCRPASRWSPLSSSRTRPTV